jgi:hypothetical protein
MNRLARHTVSHEFVDPPSLFLIFGAGTLFLNAWGAKQLGKFEVVHIARLAWFTQESNATIDKNSIFLLLLRPFQRGHQTIWPAPR